MVSYQGSASGINDYQSQSLPGRRRQPAESSIDGFNPRARNSFSIEDALRGELGRIRENKGRGRIRERENKGEGGDILL